MVQYTILDQAHYLVNTMHCTQSRSKTNRHAGCRRLKAPRRAGYVLVMCLLAVAISSGIVLTLFNVLRVQTAESLARRTMTANISLGEAGVEHAVAVLLDQPNFRGNLGPFTVPTHPDRSYTISLVDVSGDVAIAVNSRVGTSQAATARLITSAALTNRRAALGL